MIPINQILCGDVLEKLVELPDESVHCVLTSPPYWGLRDYKVEGQLGLEKTPEEYVDKMVQIFREVRRVMRSDGTLWLNCGDSYANSNRKTDKAIDSYGDNTKKFGERITNRPRVLESSLDLKDKDLCGIPWRLALALQSDGWWLRSAIVWAKGESFNPDRSGSVMPESVNGWRWERHRIES